MKLEEALKLADQDCPLPSLAGPALKLLRDRLIELLSRGNCTLCDGTGEVGDLDGNAALCDACEGSGNADPSERAAVPNGWKLVPREPTDEMQDAFQEEQCRWHAVTHVDDEAVVAIWEAMLAAAPQPAQEAMHPDDIAVDRFAAAMKEKLAAARAKGRGGWENDEPGMQQRLSDMLRAHVEKGDPRDVANFCMFLHQRGEAILPAQEAEERCESGLAECGPVEHWDSEGIPLCAKCWGEFADENVGKPAQEGVARDADFTISNDTPRILTWSGNKGCRPATEPEIALWDALIDAMTAQRGEGRS